MQKMHCIFLCKAWFTQEWPKFAPLRSHLRFSMTIQTVFEYAQLTRGYESALTHLVEVEYVTFKTKIHCSDSAINLFPWRVHQRMTKFAPLRSLLWFSMCMKSHTLSEGTSLTRFWIAEKVLKCWPLCFQVIEGSIWILKERFRLQTLLEVRNTFAYTLKKFKKIPIFFMNKTSYFAPLTVSFDKLMRLEN